MKEQDRQKIVGNGEKPNKKHPKLILIFVVLIAIVCVGCCLSHFNLGLHLGNISDHVEDFVENDIIGTEGEVTTITESSLKKVFEISELQTADYIYNAIAEVYGEDGETLKYYVAYEGTVTAGIDFGSVGIQIDEESKEITILVPAATIQDTVVNAGTLEYIFEKNKYDNENVYKEAYETCQTDLEKKASSETQLLEMAKDNAKQVIEALVTPWVEQIDSEYTVTIE